MSLVIASNLEKSYGTQQVLRGVSFHVGPGEKVALVGRNGSGKTTLLRLVAGLEVPDRGTLSVLPRTRIGYLRQDPDLSGGDTLFATVAAAVPRILALRQRLNELEARLARRPSDATALYSEYAEAQEEYAQLGGPAYDGRVKATLAGLGFRESDFGLPVTALSGGQRTRAGLGMLLLQEPDLLLLDEPTNHLDLPAVEWLETYLARTRSAVLLVSHDRYFLDRVVNRVIELEDGISISYPGNYTAYARQREERLARLQAEYERNLAYAQKLQQYIDRYRVSRATMAKSREKALARLHLEQPHLKRPDLHVRLTAGLRSGDDVLRVEGLSKAFDDRQLFRGLDLVVHRGERLGIVGPNGSGKTTFLRILVGQVRPDAGQFHYGHNVEPGYFAQDLSGANPHNTLLDEVLEAGASTFEEARALLARFLFFGDDVFKRVCDLSGGEANRLALARLLLSRANLLLLDEPTNHLDIAARDRLEEALRQFDGTILFASHDRYLLDRLATRILEISGGEARVYPGAYADYRRRREREALLAEQARARAQKAAPKPPPARPLSGMRPQELRRAVKQAEEKVAAVEGRLAELSAFLANPANYSNGEGIRQAQAEYETLNASLPKLLDEWERLAEAAEAVSTR
ncbi:MAG: ABC-F family ATP-binding cassette domain-containing protein [Armatimonadota bacterium]|nr:ABC-F family ATP-binding cassette domain-containing protein [Armatimonadota bacterium]